MYDADSSRKPSSVTLIPAGRDSWRAIDRSYPLSDARCLLAYVEYTGGRYVIMSLVPPLGGVTEASSLAEVRELVRSLRTHSGAEA